MKSTIRELKIDEFAMIAGGWGLGFDSNQGDVPREIDLQGQYDRSNRIVHQWMADDPAFAAQLHQYNADSLTVAGFEAGWVLDEDGYSIPSPEAQAYLDAGQSEWILSHVSPPPSR